MEQMMGVASSLLFILYKYDRYAARDDNTVNNRQHQFEFQNYSKFSTWTTGTISLCIYINIYISHFLLIET